MNNMQPPAFDFLMKQYRQETLLLLLGALCLLAACSRDDFSSRKYIATVNGERIYLDEYQQRVRAQNKQFSFKAFPDSLKKQEILEKEVLESMITEKIVLQRAREINLSVSDTELEKKINDIQKDYGTHFFNFLKAQNVRYEDWREELRKEMLFDKLVAVDVNASVRVSENEAKDYFNKHPGLCKSEARVHAAQIVVRDAAKANAIMARLKNGEDFAVIAAQASIGPEAVRGGDLGLISRQTMPEPLDKTLFKLPAGKISTIVKSAYGYHIFKVLKIEPARTRSFSDCKEVVLAGILAQKKDAAFTVWLERLKIKAIVKKENLLLQSKAQK